MLRRRIATAILFAAVFSAVGCTHSDVILYRSVQEPQPRMASTVAVSPKIELLGLVTGKHCEDLTLLKGAPPAGRESSAGDPRIYQSAKFKALASAIDADNLISVRTFVKQTGTMQCVTVTGRAYRIKALRAVTPVSAPLASSSHGTAQSVESAPPRGTPSSAWYRSTPGWLASAASAVSLGVGLANLGYFSSSSVTIFRCLDPTQNCPASEKTDPSNQAAIQFAMADYEDEIATRSVISRVTLGAGLALAGVAAYLFNKHREPAPLMGAGGPMTRPLALPAVPEGFGYKRTVFSSSAVSDGHLEDGSIRRSGSSLE